MPKRRATHDQATTRYWVGFYVEAYLDYLVVERDAGRIKPMFLSEWAWAKVTPA